MRIRNLYFQLLSFALISAGMGFFNPVDILAQCVPVIASTPPGPICSGSTFTITANVSLPSGCLLNGAAPYTFVDPSGQFNQKGSTKIFTNAAPGNYRVQVSLIDDGTGTCPCTFLVPGGTAVTGLSNTIVVTAIPSAPSISPPAAICEGESATITATANSAGGDLHWYTDPATTNQVFVGNTYTTPPLSPGAAFYVKQIVNGCDGPVSSVFPTVFAEPTAPLGVGTSICPGNSASLTASTGLGGATVNWYDAPVGGSLLTTGTAYLTPPLFQTTIYYAEVVSASGCASVRTPVTATVLPLVARPIAQDIFICEGEQGVLTAIGSGTSGNAFVWYDVPFGGTPLKTTPMPTAPASPEDTLVVGPFLSGAQVFYVAELDAATGCESQRTAVTVFVTEQVPEPQAIDRAICSGDTVTLQANYGVGSNRGDFYWYSDSTGGTLLQIGQIFTPANAVRNNAGTYDFWVEEQYQGCVSPTRERVTLNVNPLPATPVAGNVSVCEGNSATLNAVSFTPSTTIEWYSDPNGNNLLGFSSTYVTQPLTQSTTFYFRASNFSTGCLSNFNSVDAMVFNRPPAPSASNVSVCETDSVRIQASGSNNPIRRLDLYDAAGNLVAQGPLGSGPNTFNIGLLGQGTYAYFIEEVETTTNCVSSRTSITVTVSTTPGNPLILPATVCSGQAAQLTASSASNPGAVFNWYTDPALNNLVQIGTSYNTPALSTSTTYYVTEVVGGCEGNASPVTVTVVPAVGLPTASNDTICAGQMATLTATGSGFLSWYANPAGGNALATGPSFTTSALAQNTTFYIESQTVGNGCQSGRVPVEVVVQTRPNAPTGTVSSTCAGQPISITATGSTGSAARMDLLDANGNLIQSGAVGSAVATFSLGNLGTATYQYFIREADVTTGCVSNLVPLSFIVAPVPAAPSAAAVTVCAGTTAILSATSNSGGAGPFNWYADAGLTNLLFTGTTFTTPPLSQNTTYYVTESTGNCESPATSVGVSVTTNPTLASTSSDTICAGETATLTATGNATVVWYSDANGSNQIFVGTTFVTPPLSQNTTYYVRAENFSAGCRGTLLPVTVELFPTIPAPSITLGVACVSSPVAVTVTGSGQANRQLALTDANGNILQTAAVGVASAQFTLTGQPVGTVLIYAKEIDVITGCESSTTGSTLTVNSVPAPPLVLPQAICPGNTATLIASSISGLNGSIRWYADVNLTNLLATGSQFTTAQLSQSATYYATEIANGCESGGTPAVVQVGPTLSTPTIQNDTVCAGQAATLLASGSGGILNWYDAPTATTPIFTGPSYTTPVLSQSTTYYVRELNVATGCQSPLVAVQAVVVPLPASPNVVGGTFCASDTVILTASGSGGVTTQLNLYNAAGNLLQSGPVGATSVDFDLGQLSVGSYVFYVEETAATGCASARTSVTIDVLPTPATPTAQSVTICAGETATLTANGGSATNGTFRWYADAGLDTLLATGQSYTTGPLTQSQTYYLTETLGGCQSNATSVDVIVNPAVAAPGVQNDTICDGQSATLTASGSGGILNWYDAPTTTTPIFTGPSYTTAVLSQSTTYYVRELNVATGCQSPLVAVQAVVVPLPQSPTVVGGTFCASDTVILTASGSGGTTTQLNLYNAAGNLLQSGPVGASSFDFDLGQLSVGSYVYYVEETAASGCASPRTSVTIDVLPTPATPTAQSVTICAGETATLVANGGSVTNGTFRWYADAGLDTLLATGQSYTTGPLQGSMTFYLTETLNGCESNATSVDVIVNPAVAAPGVQNDTICDGQSATLLASGSGGILNWYDAPTTTTPIFTGPSYTTAVLSQSTTYYVRELNVATGCQSPLVAVQAVVVPLPASPNVVGGSFCASDTVVITASGSGGTTTQLNLYNAAGNLLQSAPVGASSFDFDLGQLSVGSYVFYVEETAATGCASARTSVTIDVLPTPATPTAQSVTICAGETATLTANGGSATNGTFRWYADAGLDTLLATGQSYTTGPLQGSMTFYLTETLNGCESNATSVDVIVNPAVAAPGVQNDTICDGQSATLTASGSGGILNWFATTTATTPIFTGPSYTTPVLSQSTTYYVRELNVATGCQSPLVAVQAVVVPLPASPNVVGGTFCASDTVVITASGSGGTTTQLNLYNAAGNLLQSAPVGASSFDFDLGQLSVGSYVFYVEETAATGCASARTSVTIDVLPTPATPTAQSVTICAGETATLTANGGSATNGTFRWYADAGLDTLLATGQSYTTGPLTQSQTYYLTETLNGCQSNATSVDVIVNPAVAAPGVQNDTVCSGQAATLLASGSGGILNWFATTTATTPIFTGPSYTTPVLSQSTTYYVRELNVITSCESPLVAVEAVVVPLPASPNVVGGTFCASDTVVITASGSGGTTTQLNLYNAAGNLLQSAPVGVSSFDFDLGQLSVGSYVYYVEETAATGCASARTSVTIDVLPTPATPTAQSVTICAGETATLTANGGSATNGTFRWYADAGLDTLLATGQSYTTGPLTQSQTYYLTETLGGCQSNATLVDVIVNPAVSAPGVQNDTVCSGQSATLTASGSGGILNWYDAPTATTPIFTGPSYTTPVLSQSTTYYVRELNVATGCESPLVAVEAVVVPLPSSPNVVGGSFCASDTVVITASGSGGTTTQLNLYNAAGNLLQSAPVGVSSFDFDLGQLSVGSYVFYVEETAATGCASPRTSVTIDVLPTPATPTAQSVTICAGETATLTANGGSATNGTFRWYADAGLDTLLATGQSYTTGPLTQSQTYYLTETLGGCQSNATSVDVIVNPAVAAPGVQNDTVCSGQAATLTASGSGGILNWYDAPTATTPIFTGPSYTTAVLSQSTTYYVRELNVATGCESPLVAVEAVVVPLPASPNVVGGSFCASDTVVITASGSGGVTTQLNLYNAAGNLLQSGPIGASSFDFDLGQLSVGSYVFYIEETAATGCASARTSVTIDVLPTPATPTAQSVTICAGETATLTANGGSATNGTFRWYADAGLDTLLATGQSYTTGPLQGSMTFYLTETLNGCESNATSVDVIVNPAVAAPGVQNDTICDGQSATLTASGSGGILNWFATTTATTPIFTGPSYTTPVLSQSTTYYVRELNVATGCESPLVAVEAVVIPLPPSPNVVGGSFCASDTVVITASGSGGTTTQLNLYNAAGNLLQSAPVGASSFDFDLGQLSVGSYVFYVEETAATGCASARTSVTIDVLPTPATPTAQSVTICAGETATLTANGGSATNGTFRWYADAGLDTLLATGQSYTTGPLQGSMTFYLTETLNGCESNATSVDVIVNPAVAAPGVQNDTICDGQSATLTASGSGGILNWFATTTATTPIFTGPSYTTPILSQSTTYYVRELNVATGCESPLVAVEAVVIPLPPSPNVVGGSFCASDTVLIRASGSGGVTTQLNLYNAAGNLLQSGPIGASSFDFDLGQLSVGSYVFYVEETAATGCASARTSVTIDILPTPATPTAQSVTICAGETATLTANGGSATNGTFRWYADAGLDTLLATGQSYTTGPLTQSQTYYLTETLGGCQSNATSVDVIVNPAVPAPSVQNDTICDGQSATLLASGSGGILNWYDAPTATTPIFTGPSYTTPILSQSTTYYVRELNVATGCESPLVAVQAVVVPLPAAPSANNPTFCASDTARIVVVGSGSPTNQLVLLSQMGLPLQAGGIGSANVTFDLGQLSAGTYNYIVREINVNTGCQSAPVPVIITVLANPGVPSVSGTAICAGETATLVAISTSGSTVNWYADSLKNTLLFTGNSFTTPVLFQSRRYFVAQLVGGCEGPTAGVTVIVNAKPADPVPTPDTVCAGQPATLMASGSGGILNWYADASGTNLLASGPTFITPSLFQNTVFYVRELNSSTSCESELVPVQAVVYPLPPVPSASRVTACNNDSAFLIASGTGSMNRQLRLFSAGGSLLQSSPTGVSTFAFNLGILSAGTYTFFVDELDLTTTCVSAQTSVTVTVNPAPANPLVSSQAICAGTSTVISALSGSNTTGSFSWYADSALANLLFTGSRYNTPVLQQTTTFFVTETLNGCTSNVSAVIITVDPAPADPVVNSDTVCSGEMATLMVTNTQPGTAVNWYNSPGSGTPIFTGMFFTTPPLTQSTTFFVEQVQIGNGCVSNRVPVTISVYPNVPSPTVAPITVCANDSAILTITGTGGNGRIFRVFDQATGGNLVASGGGSNLFQVNLGLLPAGNYQYFVEEFDTNTGCASTRVSVNVDVLPVPATPIARSVAICEGESTTLTASVFFSSVGVFNWYADANLDTLLFTGKNFSTGPLSQTTIYYVTHQQNGCESAPIAVTVTVNPLPASPVAQNDTVCAGQSATLTATGANVIQWYADPAGQTLLFTGSSFTTAALQQTTTYYVAQTVSGTGCRSSLVAVQAVVVPAPVAPSAGNVVVCASDTASIVANGTGGANRQLRLFATATGGTPLQVGAPGASQVSFVLGLLPVGTTQYFVDEFDAASGCASARVAVRVTVDPAPTAPSAANATICAGQTATLSATSTGGTSGTFSWYADSTLQNLLFTGSSFTTAVLQQTTTYYVTETVGNCESFATSVTVTVNPLPASPVAQNDTVCAGQSATLTATGANVIQWYADPAGQTLLFTGSSFTTAALQQTTTYYVAQTVSGTGCRSSLVAVQAVVVPAPVAPSAGNVVVCASDTASIVANGTGGANRQLRLFATATGGTPLQVGAPGASQVSFVLGLLPVGTTQYFVDEFDAASGCASARVAVRVTVDPAPTAPSAANATICAGQTATLSATSTGGTSGTFSWYADSTLQNLLFTGSSFTTAALQQTTTYYVTETVGNCESFATSVTVTVNPLPASPVAQNDTVCAGQSATLSATGANVVQWYADPAGQTLLFTGSSYTTAALQQTTTYYVAQTVSGTGCRSSLVAVQAVVVPAPVAPSVGNVVVCASDTASIVANGTGGANRQLRLFATATGGTPLQVGAPGAAQVSFVLGLLPVGTTQYFVDEFDAASGCASARVAVRVTVDPAPTAPSAANATICAGQTATLSATSTGGTSGTFSWYADSTLQNLLFTGSSFTTAVLQQTTTYYVTETVGNCESFATSVTVTVNPLPASPVAQNDTVCAGQSATLSATGANVIQWYADPAGQTLLFTGSSYTTAALQQTTTYYVAQTVSGTGCRSSLVVVQAVVVPAPVAPSAGNVVVCASDTASIVANGTGGANRQLRLFATATGGTPLQVGAPGASQVSFVLGLLPVGTTQYFVDEFDVASGCASARVAVRVTVDPAPTAPSAANATICAGQTATLSATSTGGTSGTFSWYADSTLQNLLFTGSSFTTAALQQTTTYYVTETVGNCESFATSVTVTVNPLPASPVAQNDTVCAGQSATLSATGANVIQWFADPAGQTLLFTGSSFTTAALQQTTTYYVAQTVSGTGCRSSLVAVQAVVVPAPVAPSAGNVVVCASDTASIVANGTGGANRQLRLFATATGGTPLQVGAPGASQVSFVLGLLPVGTTQYFVDEFDAASGCASARVAVRVTVDPAPTAPSAANATICAGQTATLSATSTGGTSGTFSWYADSTLQNLLFTGSSFTTAVLQQTTTYYVTETVGNCESFATSVTVTVNPLPASPVAQNDTVCAGQSATLTATGANVIQWYADPAGQTLLFTGSSFTTAALQQTTTYYVAQTVSGTGCRSSLVAVQAVVVPAPVAPSAGNVVVCASEDAILNVSTTGQPNVSVVLYNQPVGGIVLQRSMAGVTPVSFNLGQLAVGRFTYYIENEDNQTGCTSARIPVTVIVDPAPTPPLVNGTTLCGGGSANLTATSGGGTTGTFNWYADSTLTSLLFTGVNYATGTLNTTQIYWVTETVGGCESAPTRVIVTIAATPSAPIVVPAQVCSGSSAALVAAGVPGNIISWYDNPQGTNLLATGNVYNTPALSQNTTYWVSQRNPITGCESPLVAVAVSILPLPAAPAATDVTICEGETAFLQATGSGFGSLRWYNSVTSTTPLQVDGMPPATAGLSVGPFAVGVQVFYVEEFDNTCPSARVPITVTVLPKPLAPLANGTTICSGETATLSARTNGGSGRDFRWYDSSGTVLLYNGRTFTTQPLTQTTVFTVVELDSLCEGPQTQVTVTVAPTPAAPIVTGDTLCANGTATLSASGQTGNFLNWYDDPNGQNLLFTGSNFVSPTLTQTTTYFVRQVVVGTGCASPLVPVTAVVALIPPTPSATPLALCEGATGSLLAVGSGGATRILNWYDSPTFPLPLQTGMVGQANLSLAVGPFTAGNYVYYAEEEDTQTGCKSARYPVAVQVTPQPAQPSINDTSICAGSSVTLTAPGTGTYNWYDAPTGGNLIYIGLQYTTPVLNSTRVYYVSFERNGCESPRETVVVTVNANPVAGGITTNSPVCEGDTLTFSTANVPGIAYEWRDPNGAIRATTPSWFITNAQAARDQGRYTLVITSISTGCSSPVASTVVTVNPRPATPTISANNPVCAGSDLRLTVPAVPGATYTWTGPSGPLGTTSIPSFVVPSVTPADSGTYTVTISLGNCPSLPASIDIRVEGALGGISVSSNSPICSGEDLQLMAMGGVGGSYQWTGPNGFNANLQNPRIDNALASAAGTYSVSYISPAGCRSTQPGTIQVTVNPLPPTVVVLSNAPVTEGDSLRLFAPLVPGVAYNWTGPAGFISTSQNPVIPSVTEGDNQGIYTLFLVDTATGCASPPADIFVNIDPGSGGISLFADNDGPVCGGDNVQLRASTVSGATYQWSGPNGYTSSQQNPVITNVQGADAGTYTVTVTLPDGRNLSASTTVSVGNGLPVNAGVDQTITVGETAQLAATGALAYEWSPAIYLDFTNIPNPTVQGAPIGTYTYVVTGTDGSCTGTDTVVVNVVPEGGGGPIDPNQLVIFDLFTPNGDNINDTWMIQGIDQLSGYTLRVINRSGIEVLNTTSYQNDWDGTYRGRPLPDGTYWYIIDFGGERVLKGAISLIR